MQRYIKEQIEFMTEELVISAGHNPALDSFRSGSISAFRDILNYDFNTQEQGEV